MLFQHFTNIGGLGHPFNQAFKRSHNSVMMICWYNAHLKLFIAERISQYYSMLDNVMTPTEVNGDVSTAWQEVIFLDIQTDCLVITHLPLDKMAAVLAADIFRCISVNEKLYVLIEISLKLVPKGQIDNDSAFVQVMTWCQFGDKPLSEPMLTEFTDTYMRH